RIQTSLVQVEAARETKIRSEIVSGSLSRVGTAVTRTAARRQDANESLVQSRDRQYATVGGSVQIAANPAQPHLPAQFPASPKSCTKSPVKECAAVGVNGLIRIIDDGENAPVILKRPISGRRERHSSISCEGEIPLQLRTRFCHVSFVSFGKRFRMGVI